jgi:hypothetical protein
MASPVGPSAATVDWRSVHIRACVTHASQPPPPSPELTHQCNRRGRLIHTRLIIRKCELVANRMRLIVNVWLKWEESGWERRHLRLDFRYTRSRHEVEYS